MGFSRVEAWEGAGCGDVIGLEIKLGVQPRERMCMTDLVFFVTVLVTHSVGVGRTAIITFFVVSETLDVKK